MPRHERERALENFAGTRVVVALIESMDAGPMKGEVDLHTTGNGGLHESLDRLVESWNRIRSRHGKKDRWEGGWRNRQQMRGRIAWNQRIDMGRGVCWPKWRLASHVLEIEIRIEQDEAPDAWLARAHEHARQRSSRRIDGNAHATRVDAERRRVGTYVLHSRGDIARRFGDVLVGRQAMVEDDTDQTRRRRQPSPRSIRRPGRRQWTRLARHQPPVHEDQGRPAFRG